MTHPRRVDRQLLTVDAFTEGFTNSAGVYEPGLDYEFAGLLAAELPVSSSCDAVTCFPMTPPEVITGSTAFDRDIGFFDAIIGKATERMANPSRCSATSYQVPIRELINGYTFGSTTPAVR